MPQETQQKAFKFVKSAKREYRIRTCNIGLTADVTF